MSESELLARIDERTQLIYTLVEKQEQHLAVLNGSVARIKEHQATQDERAAGIIKICQERHPQSSYSSAKKGGLIAAFATGSLAVGYGVLELIKLLK